LQKYNRFLEPILEEMKATNPAHAQQIEKGPGSDLSLAHASSANAAAADPELKTSARAASERDDLLQSLLFLLLAA